MPGFEHDTTAYSRGIARMARLWLKPLVMLPMVGTLGCLVTESPSFLAPERSAPKLVNVSPEPTELLRVPVTGQNYELPSFQFQIVSEDAGQRVDSRLVIDYGLDPATNPGFDFDLGESIAPGNLSDGPRPKDRKASIDRKLSRLQYSPDNNEGRSCRTVTLFVSHEFRTSGERYCPASLADSDQVSWFVALCPGSDASPDACPIVGCPSPMLGSATSYCTDGPEEVGP
jgi:hypothetical protein